MPDRARPAEGALSQSPDDVRALNLLVQGYSAQNQMAAGLQARDLASRQPGSASVQQFWGSFSQPTATAPGREGLRSGQDRQARFGHGGPRTGGIGHHRR